MGEISYLKGSNRVKRKTILSKLWLTTDGRNADGAHKISGTFATFSVGLLMCIGILSVKYLDGRLPDPLQIKDVVNYPNNFIEERARNDLVKLTSFGPRVSGSSEADNITVGLILDILQKINESKSSEFRLEYEVQKPSGCFYRNDERKALTCYLKISNVIAKLTPTVAPTNHSILVNCHFDSKQGSPGATDDMMSCSIMLEIIRVLSSHPNYLKNSIIFLFNGAEELGMKGAHGFISGFEGGLENPNQSSGHRWAKSVKTFINLEGAGGGGREMLFQTGPGNPWTLKTYAKAVPYPYAVVVAEEAFQMGLIPSYTDFKVFTDFGNLSGLDMAFIKNGWVYHTKWDKINEIPPGSMQHMGSNTLQILKHFGQLDFNKVEESDGKMVYFDVFGLFMIYYPRWAGILIDCVVGLISIIVIVLMCRGRADDIFNLIAALVWLLLNAFISWIVGIIVAILTALFLNECGYYKPFYSYPTLALIIFGFPAAIGQTIFVSYSQKGSPLQACAGQKLALALILFVGTFVTRALFILSINLIFSVIFFNLNRKMCQGWPGTTTLSYLITGELIPFLMSYYLLLTLSDVFVPILGHSGDGMNANLFFGVIVAAFVSILIWNGFLFIFVQFRRRVLWLSLFVVFFVVNPLLGFGFVGDIPYQEKTPLKLAINDAKRIWYNVDGTINRTDSGYIFIPEDSNMKDFLATLTQYVPELDRIAEIDLEYEDCKDLYCGQPFMYPSSVKSTHWLSNNKTLPFYFEQDAILNYTIIKYDPIGFKTVDFSLQGPTQISLVLSPGPNYELESWTLPEEISEPEKWKGRNTYFVYAGREMEQETLEFSCSFRKLGESSEQTLLSVQYSAFYLHGNKLMTNEFKGFVERMPSWTYTMGWSSVAQFYEIM